MTRRRRSVQTLNLSFLDAISCGFGAVILLLVIAKIYEPIRLEESEVELNLLVARYEEELEKIIGETRVLERERQSTSDMIVLGEAQIDNLRERLAQIRSDLLQRRDDAEFSNELEGRLAQAKQSLTDEMRRLLADCMNRRRLLTELLNTPRSTISSGAGALEGRWAMCCAEDSC